MEGGGRGCNQVVKGEMSVLVKTEFTKFLIFLAYYHSIYLSSCIDCMNYIYIYIPHNLSILHKKVRYINVYFYIYKYVRVFLF